MMCDQCEQVKITKENGLRLAVRIMSYRVATSRHWSFCSETCRDDWWEDVEGVGDFLPVSTPADIKPDVTLPAGSDLNVRMGGPSVKNPDGTVSRDIRAEPQTLTVDMSTATDFDVVSSTLGALGSGAFEVIEIEDPDDPENPILDTVADFVSTKTGAPRIIMRVRDAQPAAGDQITIVYKGSSAPALFDDPSLPDEADPKLVDRDLNVDVFRSDTEGKSVCVEARQEKRPGLVNDWWGVAPIPEEGGPISARAPVEPMGGR